MGPAKLSSGVVMPDPEDPNKAIVTKLDKGNLKYMPSFALRMMIENKLEPMVQDIVAKFKKSSAHARLSAQ